MDRRCPDAFRRRLQASSPDLDCVYFGDGHWLVVVWRGPTARCHDGRKLAWEVRQLGISDLSVHQQAALMAEGWAGVYQFQAPEPTEAHAVEALRRFYATDAEVRAGLAAAVDASCSEPRKRRLQAERLDFIQTEARAIHRFTSRRPVSIIRPEMRPARRG